MKIGVVDEESYTKNELDFVSILEENELFEKVILSIRKKVGIPSEGCQIQNIKNGKIGISGMTKETQSLIALKQKEISHHIYNVMKAFRLPENWNNVVKTIILFNAAIPTKWESEYKPLEIRYTGGLRGTLEKLGSTKKNPFEHSAHIEIDIREGMTFGSLIERLREHEEELKEYLKLLDKTPRYNTVNLPLNKEMAELRKKGYSYKKISNQLLEKEFCLPFAPDENIVAKYTKRFAKTMSKIPSKHATDLYLAEYLE